MLIPKHCIEVGLQCPIGQERGYKLGWYQGQIDMADTHDGSPCQVIRLQQDIDALYAVAWMVANHGGEIDSGLRSNAIAAVNSAKINTRDRRMKSNIIDIEGSVHHWTEKAVLFSKDGNRDNAEWLPLSQVEVDGAAPFWTITLPEQLALDKGLI